VADRFSFPKSAGFYKAPFRSEPDPYFFFTYEAFEQRLETLRRLLRSGQELTLIVGEGGSGKTTLLQRYLATSNGDWKTYRLRLPGEHPDTEPEIHPAYMVRGPAMRLIVDDAHLLRRHSLRLLIRRALANASGAGMQLMLIAEPAIEKDVIATVRAIDTEKAVNRLYMPRLTPEEAEEYLCHRLTMAGYSGPELFSPGEIRKLHSTSGGLPGRLNSEAQQHLQKGWRHLRGRSFDLIRKLRSGIGLTGLIIFLSAGLFLAGGLQPAPPGRKDTANLSMRSRISAPAELRKMSPWIRKMAAVQPTIQRQSVQ